MKKLIILLFAILTSFNSYGEWKVLSLNKNGDTFYIDVDRIKEHKGYADYWGLRNAFKPNKYGDMSSSLHYQADCGANRFKTLEFIFHKLPMGEGEFIQEESENKEWVYAPPKTTARLTLDYACDYIK
jgi:hypothetical protein